MVVFSSRLIVYYDIYSRSVNSSLTAVSVVTFLILHNRKLECQKQLLLWSILRWVVAFHSRGLNRWPGNLTKQVVTKIFPPPIR